MRKIFVVILFGIIIIGRSVAQESKIKNTTALNRINTEKQNGEEKINRNFINSIPEVSFSNSDESLKISIQKFRRNMHSLLGVMPCLEITNTELQMLHILIDKSVSDYDFLVKLQRATNNNEQIMSHFKNVLINNKK